MRETFGVWHRGDSTPVRGQPYDPEVIYRADDEDPDIPHDKLWEPFRWRPSIHMPRWASRLFLEVTDVRVERVQEVSEEGAIAEGMQMVGPAALSDRTSFAHLWDTINAKRGYSWESNPWVWVIEFRVAQMSTYGGSE